MQQEDISGNNTQNSITIGDNILSSEGGADAFLVKYDSNNEVEWTTSFGGTKDDTITTITATEDGGYLVGGKFQNDMKIGENLLSSNDVFPDAFLVKYDVNNEVEWVTSFGGENTSITSIDSSVDGGCIAGFVFDSKSINIGDYTLSKPNNIGGSYAAGLIKYNSTGNVEWVSSVGYIKSNIISVSALEDGDYIVGGSFSNDELIVGNFILNNNYNNSGSDKDCFIIRYDNNGKVKWATSFGTTNSDEINSAVATKDGGYIVGGDLGSSTTVDGFYIPCAAQGDAFLIKYDILFCHKFLS